MVEKIVKYDDRILKDFFKFHFKKLNITTVVCGVLLILCGVIYLFCETIWTGVLTCIAGVFFSCYPLIIMGMSLGQSRRMLDVTEHYVFGETELKLESERFGEVLSSGTIKYSNFQNIKETADYLYIYTTRASAIPLKKSELGKDEYSFIVTHITDALKSKTK